MTHPLTAHRWWRRALIPVGVFAVLTSGLTALLGHVTAATVTAAGVVAAVTIGGFYAFRALSRPLGRATAAAALSLVGATALGTWALVAPNCPDAADLGRCTPGEVATWALVGVLIPAAYVLVIGIPALVSLALLRSSKRFGKVLPDWIRKLRGRGRP